MTLPTERARTSSERAGRQVAVSRQAPRINRRTVIAVWLVVLPLTVALLVLAVPALAAPIGTAVAVAAVGLAIAQWLWPGKSGSRNGPTDVS